MTPEQPTVVRIDQVADLEKSVLVSVNQVPTAPIIEEIEKRGN